MKRRDFLASVGAATVCAVIPRTLLATSPSNYGNLLILIELKGGNDSLNMVVPYAASEYYALAAPCDPARSGPPARCGDGAAPVAPAADGALGRE